MKVIFLKSLPIALIAFLFAFTAQAQSPDAAKKGRQNQSASTPVSQDAEADDKMAKELELTPDQQAAFKKANDDFKAKSKANKAAKKEDNERLRAERTKAHRAVLNPKQQEKYDQMQSKKVEKRKAKASKKAQRKDAKKADKSERKAIKEELKKQ